MLTDRSRRALTLCSSLAIATALVAGSGAARAQSFQGNGTFASGSGTITTGTGTTTINLATTHVVIDWTTFDTAIGGGPINFQPVGTTATFQRVGSDFSVLNRILPTDPSRAIQFNGTIIGQIQSTTNIPGGDVYFYSPGGVIVGSTAVFNVGNLGLTSIAPAVVGGQFVQGTGTEFVQFNGAVTPGSAVTIQAGAQITSSGANGSYVAIVAPMVNNAGTINVNGVAALVSADAATITFNPTGLFDIQVTSGTSSTGNAGNGRTLINTGTITGPAFNGTGAMHRIYAVAVPKNTAITMVIGNGSSLGFNIAGAANVAGNAVILSAGHDIAGGQIVAAPSAGGGSGSVMIDSFNANYTSEVVARATGRALFASDGTVGAGNTSFAANLTAHSATIASLEARSGGSANVTGNLTLDANAFAATPTSSVTAGNAYLDARNGASLTVGGNAVVVATAQGGNATGGNADATADTGGVINVAGVLRVRAEGLGGSGGSGTGGMASVNARAGGDIFANQLNLTAEGVGGDDVGAGAGNGRGGNISLIANGSGSTINIANGNSTGTGRELFFSTARGFGGQSNGGGSGVGGSAVGGNVSISATNGATLNGPANVGTRGFVQIFARAFAGDANTGASAGGAATGGNINITVDNAIFTSAELLPSSFAQAGSAQPTATGTINGGNATGGTRNITVRNGATMTTAFSGGGPGAQGGNATLSGRGGDASGGSAGLVVDNATLTLTGRATVFSQNIAGSGGTTGNVTAGTAFGQVSNGAVVNVFDDTASANDDFSITANAFGAGSPATPGTAQGTVTAGTATLLVQGGTIQGAGTVGVGAGASAQSDQYAQGGTYRGGTANLQVQGGTISVAQIFVTANADAAAVGAGLSGTGGSATGGTARLQLNGATLSGTQLTVQSLGLGGSIVAGGAGDGGAGTGGLATIDATSGTNRLTYSRIDSIANGKGGDVSGTAGNGGAGVGGIAQINVTGGGALTVNTADSFIKANGEGGNSLSLTGNGGAGNAGRAILSVDGGSATFNGNVGLSGESVGGNGINGGNAFGDPESNLSRAFVFARNGSLMVTGQTSLDAQAFGGFGNAAGSGGNATGGFANVLAANNLNTTGNGVISLNGLDIFSSAFGGDALGTGNGGTAGAGRAVVFVNGGTITIGGKVNLYGDAFGGDGVNGGNAISARVRRALIGSNNGTISVAGSTFLSATAFGGDGRLSGTGGIAFAGEAVIDTPSNSGPGAINLAGLALDARAFGGAGGSAVPGQAGGTGGDAYGGPAAATGVAGRGVLTVSGGTTIDATAFGGTGGQGHTGGTTAPGTTGGAGGRAFGGAITVGTRSGNETLPTNSGSATFRLVSGTAGGFGGAGGAGGSGTTQGAGGSGGTGAGGSAGLLVRGSPATFGDVTFTANGVGGNGGAGSVRGNGGGGYAGDGFVIATQRFLRTERGSLDAGNVTISSTGIGGTGATTGGSFFSAAQGAEGDFFVRQADVRIANLSITSSGALAPNVSTTVLADDGSGIVVATPITIAAEPFDLNLANGTVNISGALILATPGEMRVSLDASTLNTASLTLSAGNFVLPASAPAVVGTINVSNSLSLSTQRDFRIYANLVSAAPITISALTGTVATGNLQATGNVDITAGLGITTGAVMASQNIHLDAGGTITTGALVAGDVVNASAGGALSVASASAGIVNPSTNALADYNVALRSLVSVTAGNLSAGRFVVLASPGAITVGNLSAGLGVLALAGTGLTTGSIATGSSTNSRTGVYLANFSMEALSGGQITGSFDVTPILALPPVAIGGPIAINGPVSTSNFQAATSQSFTAGAMTATAGSIEIDAGTSFNTGALTASQRIHLDAGGTITTGALVAGDAVNASAGGALSVASASAGIVNPSTNAFVDYVVTLRSLVSITAGNLSAGRYIGLGSPSAITVGNLSAGLGVLALAGTALTTGSISTGLSGTPANPFAGVYLANFSMEPLGGGQIGRHFDPAPILALPPVAISGPIAITGAITTAGVRAAATGAITTQAITVAQSINFAAGGAITTGALVAGDTVGVDAVGAVNIASASAGIVNPSTATGAEYNIGLRSLTSVVAGDLSARVSAGVSSPGSIAVGNVSVGQAFLALPGTSLTTGSINTSQTGGRVYIANNSMEALGGQIAGVFNPAPILAAQTVATAGPITINGAVTTNILQANTLQSLTISGATVARGTAALVAGTTLNAANIAVGDRAVIAAGGNITLGDVNAGTSPTLPPSGLRKIAIGSSTGTVTTGNLAAGLDLGIQAGGAISTGTLLGRQVLLLAGSNVSTGAISALVGTQPIGQVYFGNFSMANQTSNVFQTFQSPTAGPLAIFNLQPLRVGGAITIGGAVAAGQLFAAAAQGISLQAVTTPAASTQTGSGGVIDLDSGGTVTVAGRLAAGHRIDIASRDIDITQTGLLDALGSTGEIQLASNNPNGAFIGDGLTATGGYMLSQAEFARLKAGEIAIIGDDIAGLATDLTIGTLTINASQLYGANGVALFASGNRATETPSGILRIAGAVTGTGFAATNEIDLLAGTVEIEAEKGSLKVDNGSGGLGGQIVFQGDHIHVASDAILAKLRADPLYEGHIKELNAPALVQRTDGVLNALNLDFSSKSQTVYVQNTGSVAVPAGIVTRLDNNTSSANNNNNNTSNEGVRPPGGSEFVINGQIQTNTGLATGKAAFDLVIASLKAEALADGKTFASDLTPTSTLNGCVIVTGVCAFGGNTQMAPPASEISVIISPVLATSPPPPAVEEAGPGDSSASASDSEAAAEDAESSDDEKKDEGDADEAASPIAPPAPLISTRALDGDVNVVEPVSGAGNPALFGSAVNETTVQGGRP